jgi:Co/Zn/Cd efflux system component
VAALGVWATSTAWPDLAVAALMAGIFLSSSVQILRQAWAEYRHPSAMPVSHKLHYVKSSPFPSLGMIQDVIIHKIRPNPGRSGGFSDQTYGSEKRSVFNGPAFVPNV